MQGFRGAPGGAFFGLQRVGPETTLQWRNVSPMMLVMLAWRPYDAPDARLPALIGDPWMLMMRLASLRRSASCVCGLESR